MGGCNEFPVGRGILAVTVRVVDRDGSDTSLTTPFLVDADIVCTCSGGSAKSDGARCPPAEYVESRRCVGSVELERKCGASNASIALTYSSEAVR